MYFCLAYSIACLEPKGWTYFDLHRMKTTKIHHRLLSSEPNLMDIGGVQILIYYNKQLLFN